MHKILLSVLMLILATCIGFLTYSGIENPLLVIKVLLSILFGALGILLTIMCLVGLIALWKE